VYKGLSLGKGVWLAASTAESGRLQPWLRVRVPWLREAAAEGERAAAAAAVV